MAAHATIAELRDCIVYDDETATPTYYDTGGTPFAMTSDPGSWLQQVAVRSVDSATFLYAPGASVSQVINPPGDLVIVFIDTALSGVAVALEGARVPPREVVVRAGGFKTVDAFDTARFIARFAAFVQLAPDRIEVMPIEQLASGLLHITVLVRDVIDANGVSSVDLALLKADRVTLSTKVGFVVPEVHVRARGFIIAPASAPAPPTPTPYWHCDLDAHRRGALARAGDGVDVVVRRLDTDGTARFVRSSDFALRPLVELTIVLSSASAPFAARVLVHDCAVMATDFDDDAGTTPVFVDGATTLRVPMPPAIPSPSGRYALVLVFDSLPPGEARTVYAQIEQKVAPDELAARMALTARGGSAVHMASGLIDPVTGSLGYASQVQLSMQANVALGGDVEAAATNAGAHRYVVDAGVGEIEAEYRTFVTARDPSNRMSRVVPADVLGAVAMEMVSLEDATTATRRPVGWPAGLTTTPPPIRGIIAPELISRGQYTHVWLHAREDEPDLRAWLDDGVYAPGLRPIDVVACNVRAGTTALYVSSGGTHAIGYRIAAPSEDISCIIGPISHLLVHGARYDSDAAVLTVRVEPPYDARAVRLVDGAAVLVSPGGAGCWWEYAVCAGGEHAVTYTALPVPAVATTMAARALSAPHWVSTVARASTTTPIAFYEAIELNLPLRAHITSADGVVVTVHFRMRDAATGQIVVPPYQTSVCVRAYVEPGFPVRARRHVRYASAQTAYDLSSSPNIDLGITYSTVDLEQGVFAVDSALRPFELEGPWGLARARLRARGEVHVPISTMGPVMTAWCDAHSNQTITSVKTVLQGGATCVDDCLLVAADGALTIEPWVAAVDDDAANTAAALFPSAAAARAAAAQAPNAPIRLRLIAGNGLETANVCFAGGVGSLVAHASVDGIVSTPIAAGTDWTQSSVDLEMAVAVGESRPFVIEADVRGAWLPYAVDVYAGGAGRVRVDLAPVRAYDDAVAGRVYVNCALGYPHARDATLGLAPTYAHARAAVHASPVGRAARVAPRTYVPMDVELDTSCAQTGAMPPPTPTLVDRALAVPTAAAAYDFAMRATASGSKRRVTAMVPGGGRLHAARIRPTVHRIASAPPVARYWRVRCVGAPTRVSSLAVVREGGAVVRPATQTHTGACLQIDTGVSDAPVVAVVVAADASSSFELSTPLTASAAGAPELEVESSDDGIAWVGYGRRIAAGATLCVAAATTLSWPPPLPPMPPLPSNGDAVDHAYELPPLGAHVPFEVRVAAGAHVYERVDASTRRVAVGDTVRFGVPSEAFGRWAILDRAGAVIGAAPSTYDEIIVARDAQVHAFEVLVIEYTSAPIRIEHRAAAAGGDGFACMLEARRVRLPAPLPTMAAALPEPFVLRVPEATGGNDDHALACGTIAFVDGAEYVRVSPLRPPPGGGDGHIVIARVPAAPAAPLTYEALCAGVRSGALTHTRAPYAFGGSLEMLDFEMHLVSGVMRAHACASELWMGSNTIVEIRLEGLRDGAAYGFVARVVEGGGSGGVVLRLPSATIDGHITESVPMRLLQGESQTAVATANVLYCATTLVQESCASLFAFHAPPGGRATVTLSTAATGGDARVILGPLTGAAVAPAGVVMRDDERLAIAYMRDDDDASHSGECVRIEAVRPVCVAASTSSSAVAADAVSPLARSVVSGPGGGGAPHVVSVRTGGTTRTVHPTLQSAMDVHYAWSSVTVSSPHGRDGDVIAWSASPTPPAGPYRIDHVHGGSTTYRLDSANQTLVCAPLGIRDGVRTPAFADLGVGAFSFAPDDIVRVALRRGGSTGVAPLHESRARVRIVEDAPVLDAADVLGGYGIAFDVVDGDAEDVRVGDELFVYGERVPFAGVDDVVVYTHDARCVLSQPRSRCRFDADGRIFISSRGDRELPSVSLDMALEVGVRYEVALTCAGFGGCGARCVREACVYRGDYVLIRAPIVDAQLVLTAPGGGGSSGSSNAVLEAYGTSGFDWLLIADDETPDALVLEYGIGCALRVRVLDAIVGQGPRWCDIVLETPAHAYVSARPHAYGEARIAFASRSRGFETPATLVRAGDTVRYTVIGDGKPSPAWFTCEAFRAAHRAIVLGNASESTRHVHIGGGDPIVLPPGAFMRLATTDDYAQSLRPDDEANVYIGLEDSMGGRFEHDEGDGVLLEVTVRRCEAVAFAHDGNCVLRHAAGIAGGNDRASCVVTTRDSMPPREVALFVSEADIAAAAAAPRARFD
jgi:hypothetical protein